MCMRFYIDCIPDYLAFTNQASLWPCAFRCLVRVWIRVRTRATVRRPNTLPEDGVDPSPRSGFRFLRSRPPSPPSDVPLAPHPPPPGTACIAAHRICPSRTGHPESRCAAASSHLRYAALGKCKRPGGDVATYLPVFLVEFCCRIAT